MLNIIQNVITEHGHYIFNKNSDWVSK